MKEPGLLWKWILLAVAPGLVADLLGTLMAAGVRGDEGLAMVVLIFIPLTFIPYLIVLSPYAEAHGAFEAGGRTKFVIGFLVVNLFLWGGSCALALSNLSFH